MDSVIFIGALDHKSRKFPVQIKSYIKLFLVSPQEIFFRVLCSFVPPFGIYRKIYVDLLGPLLVFIALTLFLNYGYSLKKHKVEMSPTEALSYFGIVMPCLSFILLKLGKSTVNFKETLSLVGYSLYGHLVTLFVSFMFFEGTSNTFFFVSMVIFGGSSTLRLILVFVKTIPVPGARLLICSVISAANLLFLIHSHFAFMHVSFVYKQDVYNK